MSQTGWLGSRLERYGDFIQASLSTNYYDEQLETVTLSFVIIRRYNALDYTVVANCGILFVPMIIRLRMFMHVHTSMHINKKTEFR